ncbi:MAG: signal peptidase II [Candidatus Magasanikbacteria bacterium]|nr:signal peptidase II [Candidatus Magasanikbacteria bacterium]
MTVLGATIGDRLLKFIVHQSQFNASARIGWRFFAFERFHNPGIAFGVPIPIWIVLPLTLIFLIVLAIWVFRQRENQPLTHIAIAAITLGALSNAFDRTTLGYTIDYIRVLDSIINIADILVIAGIATLVFRKK